MRVLIGAAWALLWFAPVNETCADPTPPAVPTFTKPQSNYLLACGGCHGEHGSSNSRLVPDLRDQVGYYLNTREGREYLVRLPNVAFSTMSDRELTDVLNFMVFQIGGASVPAHTAPYAVAEVARLRKQPLNEVSLIDYRTQLVETLLSRHQGSLRLRIYGSDRY